MLQMKSRTKQTMKKIKQILTLETNPITLVLIKPTMLQLRTKVNGLYL